MFLRESEIITDLLKQRGENRKCERGKERRSKKIDQSKRVRI
jgi:hypothetical protein